MGGGRHTLKRMVGRNWLMYGEYSGEIFEGS